jgi:formate dehydrogenase subunit gamma
MFARYLRYNGIGIDDVKWFINIVGYFKGHEYPSGKFNAGEKLVFWFVLVLFSTILIVTGLVLAEFQPDTRPCGSPMWCT